jgi:hypothetical protein
MLTSHSDSRASLKKPSDTECLETASANLIWVIQYEIEDSVLNLRLVVNMDISDVGLSYLLEQIPDTGVTVPEGMDFGLAPGLVWMECLLGGLADLSFPERSRTHMLLLTSEVGFVLYKESEEKCFVREVTICIKY